MRSSSDASHLLARSGCDLVCRTSDVKGTNYQVPSFGYTYRLKGHPLIMKPYPDENTDSWVYKMKEEWSPELTGMDADFLFQSPA